VDPVKESGKEKAPEKRILVVDDDAKFRNVLCNFVEALGYSCVQANSGSLALALLERMRFLIVITDIVMPGMDGLASLRIIKEKYTDVDVLIITGYGARYSATKIVQTGASDFLTKPFNMEQLGARLCKIEQEKTLRNKLYSQAVTKGLRPSTPEVGRAKDNDHIHCLNCGSLVHRASVMCGNCLADPRVKTVHRSGMRGRSIDRRRSPRIVLRKTVLHDGLITTACNISAQGMQIKTKSVLSANEIFRIAFSLEDGMIRLSGHVVYANNLSDGSLLAGVRFSEVLGKDSDLLGRFLESHEVKPSGGPGGILGAIPHDSRPGTTEEAMILPG